MVHNGCMEKVSVVIDVDDILNTIQDGIERFKEASGKTATTISMSRGLYTELIKRDMGRLRPSATLYGLKISVTPGSSYVAYVR